MAYTHWSQPVGTTGIYKGAKGSEIRIDNKTILVGPIVFTSTSAAAAAQLIITPPYACTLEQVDVIQEAAAGTTTWTATVGSAGATIATVTVASAGARGDITTQTTITTPACTASTCYGIARGTSGTAYAANIFFTFTRAGS